MIDREDMLELTRRMTPKRHCFGRIAGAYMAEDGLVDGTFNTNFRNLSAREQQDKIAVAKEIPFARTNEDLVEYKIPEGELTAGSMWHSLFTLVQSELKNDALLEAFYEMAGETFSMGEPWCMLFFSGSYDRIARNADHKRTGDSEETYRFLIAAFCPLYENDEPGLPECGFLYPPLKDGAAILNRVNVYRYEGCHEEFPGILGLKEDWKQ